MSLVRARKTSRIALAFAAVGMLKVSAAALLVGIVMTLFALSPSANAADARVFLAIGPAFLLGAAVSSWIALRTWRARSDHSG